MRWSESIVVDRPLPPGLRHVAEALLGRRVRALHVADLRQLRAHVEKEPAAR